MRHPYHFAIVDGDLWDTRPDHWFERRPVRRAYMGTPTRLINSGAEMRAALRQGDPVIYLTDDGSYLCPGCVWKNIHRVLSSIRAERADGWRVLAFIDTELSAFTPCDHCGGAYSGDTKDVSPSNSLAREAF